MRNTRFKKSLIEYWFIIYTNVFVIPYYIVPHELIRKYLMLLQVVNFLLSVVD